MSAPLPPGVSPEGAPVKTGTRRRLNPRHLVIDWSSRLLIWAFTIVTLFPCAWVLAVSFRRGDAFFADEIWPRQLSWHNYVRLLTETQYPLWIYNTIKLAAWVATIQFFMTASAAYAFSRLRFQWRTQGLLGLLIFQMFPATMTLSANYILLTRLNLFDSHAGLILISSGAGAFAIWLLKGYMDSIPRELDEAAMVDGATTWQVFVKIILPLCRPFVAVQVIWTILGMFSEFMNASVFLKDKKLWPVAVGMQRYIGGTFQANNWPVFAAGAVLTSIPLVIIWMVLQRHLVAGLTRGAVKG